MISFTDTWQRRTRRPSFESEYGEQGRSSRSEPVKAFGRDRRQVDPSCSDLNEKWDSRSIRARRVKYRARIGQYATSIDLKQCREGSECSVRFVYIVGMCDYILRPGLEY